MNDRLAAMLQMAQMRDALVVQLFGTAALVLASAAMLQRAALPARLRTLLVNSQMVAMLLAWIVLIVVLGLEG